MKTVLKGILYFIAAFAGTVTALILLPIIYIAAVTSSSQRYDTSFTIQNNSVLVWDISHNISDSPPVADFWQAMIQEFNIVDNRPQDAYLMEVIDAIKTAADDNRISEMLMHGSLIPRNYGSGLATLREVKNALEYFKSKGKKITAYIEFPTQLDYYLMSSANVIVMNPMGEFTLKGLSSRHLYLGDFFQKYGIGIQTTREGKYKSAVEMFTRNSASEEDKEQSQQLINALWKEILENTHSSRNVPTATLQVLSDTKAFLTPEESLNANLIDRIAYKDEIVSDYIARYSKTEYDTFPQITLPGMIHIIDQSVMAGSSLNTAHFSEQAGVGIIYVEGEIVDGAEAENAAAAEIIAGYIRQARNDPAIKAAVLRINSPGGSAFASELIRREASLLANEKPLVVSMGNYAASGGYWIATASRDVFADSTTITGSIGVFGLLFNAEKLSVDHGITFDGVKTSAYSDIETFSRSKTEKELQIIQRFTDSVYDRFLQHVSDARKLPKKEVDSIAQGRVWTGEEAKNVKLVSEVGSLLDAVQFAALKAGLGTDYFIDHYPRKENFRDLIFSLRHSQNAPTWTRFAKSGILGKCFGYVQDQLNGISHLNDPKNVYSRLPFEIDYE